MAARPRRVNVCSPRAYDKAGKTVDFLLTAKRDKAAAMRFFEKAIQANDVPQKVTHGQEWGQ